MTNYAMLSTEETARDHGRVARRPACECGTCSACRDRATHARRRADPVFRAAEAERARAYRAAKLADRRWREEQRRRRRELYAAQSANADWREQRNARERRRRARARKRLAEAIEPGATAIELAERTGFSADVLVAVLRDEVKRGRAIRRRDGRVCLLPSAFPPDLLAALRTLDGPDVAAANGNGRARPPN
jgi:hypothetical protein